jgi:recombination endonuclease VII
MKQCLDCNKILDIQYFPRFSSRRDGRHSYCKRCFAKRCEDSKVKLHGSTRDFHLKRRYGLTSADVDRMIGAQGGVCAVCRRRDPQHVDHDHRTGRVRGILCSLCNQGLGNFDDDVEVMAAAIAYVRQHAAPTTPEERLRQALDRRPYAFGGCGEVDIRTPRVIFTVSAGTHRS